jgi:hypothetical protein
MIEEDPGYNGVVLGLVVVVFFCAIGICLQAVLVH